jgi:diguanylate cyclase
MPYDAEFERTLGLAETAFEHMRRLGHPPHPQNYTLWYSYAAGLDPLLVNAVDASFEVDGSLSEQDAIALHDRHLVSLPLSDDYDHLGNNVRDSVNRMAATVATSRDIMAQCSAVLGELAASGRAPGLAEAVDPIKLAARRVQEASSAIDTSLAESRVEMSKLQTALAAIRAHSLIDRNTLLISRNLFDLTLTRMLSQGQPFALAITDIDHFKSFNDRFGHLTGDQVLRLVAGAVKAGVRPQDVAARYGGEEFAIIMPNTDLAEATAVADQVRRSVMSKELVKGASGENLGRVTVSIGVSASRPDDSGLSIIDRADRCLYAAKHSGRNQVVSEADAETISFDSRVA